MLKTNVSRKRQTLLEKAKSRLRARGLTVREFARLHNLSPQAVYEVLNGRHLGHWGEAHRAAIALGLKTDEFT